MTAFTETGTMINPVLLEKNKRSATPSLASDVAMVIFWAALVPAAMWLGTVAGF